MYLLSVVNSRQQKHVRGDLLALELLESSSYRILLVSRITVFSILLLSVVLSTDPSSRFPSLLSACSHKVDYSKQG